MNAAVEEAGDLHHSPRPTGTLLFGVAQRVADPEEKRAQLIRFVNKIKPGQWDRLRRAADQELNATTLRSKSLAEASAKVRTG